MSTTNTINQIDVFFDNFLKSFEKENKKFNPSKYKNLMKLGKIIEQKIPSVIDKKEQFSKKGNSKSFKYVSWKYYEYLLRTIDEDFWWEIAEYSNNYQMVKCKIWWLGKEYSAWYAVEDSALKKETKEPLNNLGEMVVNEGMRCFAKLASRATGLFLHLWYEGDND